MFDLQWEDEAQTDLISIVAYIAADNPIAAKALRNEVNAKVAGLCSQPRIYKLGRVEGTREIVVRGNYIVVYKEDKHMVTILRVLHAARALESSHDL